MSCPLCGDETVTPLVARFADPLVMLVAQGSQELWAQHLADKHPGSPQAARQREMDAALAAIFGRPS